MSDISGNTGLKADDGAKGRQRREPLWRWGVLAVAVLVFMFWTSRPSKLWKVELGAGPGSQAALSGEAVYVCSGNVLKAFDSISGRELWSFSRDYPYMVGPPVVAGRNVLVWSSRLYSLERETGDEMWNDLSQEVFAPGSEIVVHGGWHSVAARNAATGREAWNVSLPQSQIVESVALQGDLLMVGYRTGTAKAQQNAQVPDPGGLAGWDVKSGKRLWNVELNSAVTQPAVMADGTVFAVDSGWRRRSLVAYDTDAKSEKWSVRSGDLRLPEYAYVATQSQFRAMGTVTAPAVCGDSVIIGVSDEYGDLVKCLDAETGAVRWKYDIDWQICPEQPGQQQRSALTVPVVAADDKVFFGAGEYLVKLSAGSGRENWRFKTESGGYIRQAPVVTNGVVFFGSDKGDFYAVKTGD